MKMTCEGRGRVLAKKGNTRTEEWRCEEGLDCGPWCVRLTRPLLSIRVLL